jgi:hypothetical protein
MVLRTSNILGDQTALFSGQNLVIQANFYGSDSYITAFSGFHHERRGLCNCLATV